MGSPIIPRQTLLGVKNQGLKPQTLLGVKNQGLIPQTLLGVKNQAVPVAPVNAPPMPTVENTLAPEAPMPIIAQKVAQPLVKLAFSVAKDIDTRLEGANVSVNGVPTAQTNANGSVQLPNIPPDATIKITHIGYEDYVKTAPNIAPIIYLQPHVEQLKEVLIVKKKIIAPKSNNWLWWLLAVGAFGIYQYSKTGSKVVKAKI